MQTSPGPRSALQYLDDFLAASREPGGELKLTPEDWERLRTELRIVSEDLMTSNASPGEFERFRSRLHELRQEIFRLEQSLLKKRESIAIERQQLQAASAWNRSRRLI